MEQVKDVRLTATFTLDEGSTYKGKIFLGLLGFEYAFGGIDDLVADGRKAHDMSEFDGSGKPEAQLLQYGYINRTGSPDDYAFADGVLPVYLRFQPDLVQPLTDAAQGVKTAGADYGLQGVSIDNPVVEIGGSVASRDPHSGATKYIDQTVVFTLPVNPVGKRHVTLSVQQGLFAFLAQVR